MDEQSSELSGPERKMIDLDHGLQQMTKRANEAHCTSGHPRGVCVGGAI